VHIYPEVPLGRVLEAVLRHAGAQIDAGSSPKQIPAAAWSGRAEDPPARHGQNAGPEQGDSDAARRSQRIVLALADPLGVDGFGRIRALGEKRGAESVVSRWAAESVDDRQVELRHEAGTRAVFLRGQQLVTAEGLEVLAFGMDGEIAQGASLARTLEGIRSRGGWATIAWGVGKWLGRRGKLVTEAILAEAASRDVALGDNAGRPRIWSFVPQFHVAAELGMPILPGSDPLRIPGDEARIASYGFEIETWADREDMATEASLAQVLKSAVADRDRPGRSRGRRVAAAPVVRNKLRESM
jgi:hypothetical protein